MAAPAQPTAEIRIALVTDTHTTRGTNSDQPLYRARLDKVIADVNAEGVAWVLIAGDLTQGGKPEEISDFTEQIKGFHAPVSFVYGNHDVGAKVKEGGKEGVTTKRLERIETALGPSFWVEERAGVRVVGVNSSLFGSGLPRENEQWEFLERTLTSSDGAGKQKETGKVTLLLSHYPPFLKTFDEPGDDYWNIEPGPRSRLLNLVKRSGVRAVLSGHLHRPILHQYEGVMLVTSLPVSFGLPRDHQPQGWTLLTVSAQGKVNPETQVIQD